MAILKDPSRFIVDDNFRIEVTSHCQEHLDAALRLCFAAKDSATHYRVARVYSSDARDDVSSAPSLLLAAPSAGQERDMLKLPYPINSENVARFVGDWLAVAGRGLPPCIDGHADADAFTVRGGSMYPFSSACLDSNTIAIITPAWSVYGK